MNTYVPLTDSYCNYNLWTCQDMVESISVLPDNICVRFGSSIYKCVLYTPMVTNCAALVAELFLCCHKILIPASRSHYYRFNNTSGYFDDLFNTDNNNFPSFAIKIRPDGLQFIKANTLQEQITFLEL